MNWRWPGLHHADDDGSSHVALPEVPLLAVLPGTGGLTRRTDKRKVRRDRADVSVRSKKGCGASGRWTGTWWTRWCRIPKFDETVADAPAEFAAKRSALGRKGCQLTPLDRRSATTSGMPRLKVALDRETASPRSHSAPANAARRMTRFTPKGPMLDAAWRADLDDAHPASALNEARRSASCLTPPNEKGAGRRL